MESITDRDSPFVRKIPNHFKTNSRGQCFLRKVKVIQRRKSLQIQSFDQIDLPEEQVKKSGGEEKVRRKKKQSLPSVKIPAKSSDASPTRQFRDIKALLEITPRLKQFKPRKNSPGFSPKNTRKYQNIIKAYYSNSRRKNEQADSHLQKVYFEFQKKSKFLLSELERSVLT